MPMYKHEVTEFAPKTWCLSKFKLVNAFLVEGEDKASAIWRKPSGSSPTSPW